MGPYHLYDCSGPKKLLESYPTLEEAQHARLDFQQHNRLARARIEGPDHSKDFAPLGYQPIRTRDRSCGRER
jgi:hypothetical protein